MSHSVKQKLTDLLKNKSESSGVQESWLDKLTNWVCTEYGQSVNVVNVRGATLKWIVITPARYIVNNEPFKLQLQVCSDFTYKLKLDSSLLSEGEIDKDVPEKDHDFRCTIHQLVDEDYVRCPGIKDYEEEYYKYIRFNTKGIRKWNPTNRIDSENCNLWHKMKKGNYVHLDVCSNCTSLIKRLQVIKVRAQKKSTPQKSRSTLPGCKRPMKFMSPASQKKRRTRQTQQYRDLKKLLKKMRKTDIDLNGEQSEQLVQIGRTIQDNHSDELDNVFDEISEYSESKKKLLQQMWNLDINERKDFTADQIKNGFGCRGNRYSMITYRVALAIFIR